MSVAVLEPVPDLVTEQSLDALAATVNREHAAAERAAESALAHAIAAGEALIEAQRRVPDGQWVAWVQENVELSVGTSMTYMRVATYRSVLGAYMTVSDAKAALAGFPGRRNGGRYPPVREEVLAVVRRLRAAGQSAEAIAEWHGVSTSTIHRWLDPAAQAKGAAYTRRYLRRRQAAMAALRERDRERAIKVAVRKAGAAMAELYAVTERYQDILAQAHRETTDTEARRELSLIGEDYRRMRDRVVRVLGVTT